MSKIALMETQELKQLVEEFKETLDARPDEWWASDQDIWEELSQQFFRWYRVKSEEHLENELPKSSTI